MSKTNLLSKGKRQLTKINDIKVVPLKVPTVAPENVKGKELFSKLKCNIFLLAKKESGKTTTIFNILKHCVGRTITGGKTIIVLFVSSAYKDDTWIAIRKWLEDRGHDVIVETAVYEHGRDKVQEMLDVFNGKAQSDSDEEPKEKLHLLRYDSDSDSDEEDEPRPRKPKLVAPDYFIIFDDMSKHMRRPSIAELVKQQRHYSTKVILSSQNKNDLAPEAWQQMDYILAFPNIPDRKIESICEDVDLTVEPSELLDMYKEATAEKHHFLYIDVRNNQYRKDFNQEFV